MLFEVGDGDFADENEQQPPGRFRHFPVAGDVGRRAPLAHGARINAQ